MEPISNGVLQKIYNLVSSNYGKGFVELFFSFSLMLLG